MLHVVLNNSLQKSVELNFNQPDYEFLLGSWIVGDQQVMSTICYITKGYISKTVCYSTHSLKQKIKKKEGLICTDRILDNFYTIQQP